MFPLKLGPLCNTARGGAEDREVADGDNEAGGGDAEEEQEEEEGLGGLGMGMGDREPASVAVTESADGFLVVAVVRLGVAAVARCMSRVAFNWQELWPFEEGLQGG